MKYLFAVAFFIIAVLSSSAQIDSMSATLDTLKTADPETYLLYQSTPLDDGGKDIKVVSMLVDGKVQPILDSKILLSESNIKRAYYLKKNGEDIFYTKLPDGGRYESRRTGYTVAMSDQVAIMKCVYSHLSYPEKARKRDIEGKFQLEFYLNTSGCIQDIIMSGVGHPLLEEEAKRAAKECDCQFPVLQKGESKFPTKLILPIKFKLE